MARRARVLLFLGAALSAMTAGGASSADSAEEAPYALDSISRSLPAGVPFGCPSVELVDYRGGAVRFSPSTRVFKGFRDRLAAFERVASEVGVEVYGRAPARIVHLGTFTCRRISAHPRLLSEHGLGNAVDVAGFDFGALPKNAILPAGLDRVFKNGFEVRVQKHWRASTGHAAVHARFLKTLARRLIAREDVFRVLLGPGYPGHQTHFHFDMAPYRMVQIFDEGVLLQGDPGKRAP